MLKGSIVALVTPMCDDGAIDFDGLRNLLRFHIDNSTRGIVALGTTGESVTLTLKEQMQVVEAVVSEVAGEIPVFVGNGSNSTALVVERCKTFEKYAFDGYLSVVPYYNNPSQKGMIAHFSHIAAATDKPVLLYNVPSRTVADIQPQTVECLAKVENIVGIKEATGDMSRVREIKARCGNDFICLSGDDASTVDFLRQGGDGVISVTANVAPALMSQLCDYGLKGDFDSAVEINQKLSLLHERLFIESNPVPTKWVLHQLKLISSPQVRLPLLCLEPIHKNAVKEALEFAGLTC